MSAPSKNNSGSSSAPPLSAALAKGKALPVPAELNEELDYKKSPKFRSEVTGLIGLEDKSHGSHGANCKASYSKKAIIDDVMAPLLKNPSSAKCILAVKTIAEKYNYNAATQCGT